MSPAHKARDTRRVYAWEMQTFRGAPRVSIHRLRQMARSVWRTYRISHPLPKIVAGRGTPYHGRLYSYYDGERIVLARNERQVFVLLHELTHAMGYDDHDARFMRRYLSLLRRYVCSSVSYSL